MASKKLQIADLRIGDTLIIFVKMNHLVNGCYQVRSFVDGNIVVRSIRNNKPFWEVITPEQLEAISDSIKWKRLKP